MNQDLVSIIIPVFNAGNTLARCVESILVQTYQNIEVILVDDGSTDQSFEVCCAYADKDRRIRAIHTENKGSGPARNVGIFNAKGHWAYFPDSDDYLLPNAIETMVDAVVKYKCDLLVFGFDTYDNSNKLIRRKQSPNEVIDGEFARLNYERYCMMNDPLCIQGAPWNKFFKMEVIKNNNVEYPTLRRHQDECFISRYVAYAEKICFIPDVLYYYYANDSSAVKRKYPIDYVDCVKGVYKIKSMLYYSWNPNNKAIKDVVCDEFVCNFIWALELSFNPKFQFNHKTRLNWIKSQIKDVDFEELSYGLVEMRVYQKTIVRLIRRNLIRATYCLLWLKGIIKPN